MSIVYPLLMLGLTGINLLSLSLSIAMWRRQSNVEVVIKDDEPKLEPDPVDDGFIVDNDCVLGIVSQALENSDIIKVLQHQVTFIPSGMLTVVVVTRHDEPEHKPISAGIQVLEPYPGDALREVGPWREATVFRLNTAIDKINNVHTIMQTSGDIAREVVDNGPDNS